MFTLVILIWQVCIFTKPSFTIISLVELLFFVPDDIETRLQKGSVERYNIQYERFKNYKPTDKRLLSLFGLIHRFHRCYDQEGYIYT